MRKKRNHIFLGCPNISILLKLNVSQKRNVTCCVNNRILNCEEGLLFIVYKQWNYVSQFASRNKFFNCKNDL